MNNIPSELLFKILLKYIPIPIIQQHADQFASLQSRAFLQGVSYFNQHPFQHPSPIGHLEKDSIALCKQYQIFPNFSQYVQDMLESGFTEPSMQVLMESSTWVYFESFALGVGWKLKEEENDILEHD